MQPSEKQLSFAQDIAKELNIELPKNTPQDREVCSNFINTHKEKFYQKLNTNNEAPFKSNDGKSIQKVKKTQSSTKKQVVQSDKTISKSNEHVIIKYWHEGLTRTAFEGYGSLESELNDVQSFSFEKIEYALTNFCCKNLKDLSNSDNEEGTIRHLVMMLESTKAAQTERANNKVLLIFPLAINSDDSNPVENKKVPYLWQRAGRELPIFNQRLLGEEAELDGLQLHKDEALDKLLLGADVDFFENASLQQCLSFLDKFFNELTSKDYGLTGWIDEFASNQNNHAGLRNKQVRFKLVDGSAVSGATRSIRLCYEELLRTEHAFKYSALGLFRKLFGQEEDINKVFPKSFMIDEEKRGWEQLCQYLGHMDNYVDNNNRSCYPLDPSQRLALTLFKKVPEGN